MARYFQDDEQLQRKIYARLSRGVTFGDIDADKIREDLRRIQKAKRSDYKSPGKKPRLAKREK